MDQPQSKPRSPHLLYAVVALILGAAAIGTYAYFRSQDIALKERQALEKSIEQRHVQDAKELQQRLQDNCIEGAETEYATRFRLNSKEVAGAEAGVRRWDSADIRKAVEDKLQSDKELCLKQYPVQ